LLLSDASAAAKVLGLGLCEALAIQVIIPGYVKSALEALEAAPRRAFWICVVLFGIVFGLRAALAAAIQPDAEAGFVLAAAIALAVAGMALGVVFVYLRDRTSTLLPGILLHWLVIAIVPAAVG
jgi:membrane protease YdiL (CAAX protease family)